jgi:hypothetical protein
MIARYLSRLEERITKTSILRQQVGTFGRAMVLSPDASSGAGLT